MLHAYAHDRRTDDQGVSIHQGYYVEDLRKAELAKRALTSRTPEEAVYHWSHEAFKAQ